MEYSDYNGFFAGQSALVTGGAGFIGSHLTQHLASLGCQVRVLDDFSTGHAQNIKGMDVECIKGSILDNDMLKEATNGCQFVFHLAAFVSIPQSIETPELCVSINVHGTECVMKAAGNAGCSRVVLASSAACYGSNPQMPSCESDEVSLESPYAESKYAAEQLIATCEEVDGVSLRFFNVFGQRQDPQSQYAAVVSAFKDAFIRNQTPVIYGDGSQTRDFTAVENVVHASLLAASHQNPLGGDVFNVGTGTSISLQTLIETMAGGDEIKVDYQPARNGDVQHSCADITAISEVLGYAPVLETERALQALLNPTQP